MGGKYSNYFAKIMTCCVFGGVRVVHKFSFLCCVFGGVRVVDMLSFLCCVFDGVRVVQSLSFQGSAVSSIL